MKERLMTLQFVPNHNLHVIKNKYLYNSRNIAVQSGSSYTDAVRSTKMSKDSHVKRPMNCFLVYCKHKRANVQEMHPDESSQEIGSILGRQWNALSTGK